MLPCTLSTLVRSLDSEDAPAGPKGMKRGHLRRKYYTRTEQVNRSSSSVFNSISPTGGDGGGNDSDFVYHCAQIITLGLCLLGAGAGGGLPGGVSIV